MIGITIHNRYQLLEELGKGGMGTVYRALDTFLEREIAIKVLSGQNLGSAGQARLLNEARAIARLNHPHIVAVYDAGTYEGQPFIVMELLKGHSLYERSPHNLEQALEIIRQVCLALDHAHKRGIIHRDIKPENVIITEDGTVKLMDFGLARSLASRLSGDGALVGTVFYIAPEQALGQEIDQRADLYSLGVMLYELVTGHLPFTADDPFAVITQHLYASVLPPRARNENVPLYLDALILQLLSKKPEDRPSSATEVLERLAAGDAGREQMLTPEPTFLLGRIVRGRMVGRERELREIRQLWKKALGGQGQLLLISGEPGIGKSRLVRELFTQVDVSGRAALSGECYAEGGAPYGSFAPVLRKAVLAEDGHWMANSLPGYVLADVLTIAPELRLNFPDVPTNPPLDPQAEQQRLFENITMFFAAQCQHLPTLLVLEDVHWADQGTLMLMRHLARRLQPQPFMIVATYREVELDKGRPFHDVLLAIQRERLGIRIKLSRLDRQATQALLETILDAPIPADFLEAIYRETEGNPFFIEEVCKDLVDSGKLCMKGCCWVYPSRQELEIPQSVRIAIQARVERLPETAQQVLHMAAIFGREFDFDTLREAVDVDDDNLVGALESAERAQVIDEVSSAAGGTFSFAHALIPAALIDSTSGIRRRRMHRKAADILEKLHPEDYEALAYQYLHAEVEDKALQYLTLAGQRAQKRFANDEAILLYTQALEFAEPVSAQTFDLLQRRVEIFDVSARREEQIADIRWMLELAEKLNDNYLRLNALFAQADYFLNTDYSQAQQPAEQALVLSRQCEGGAWEGRALHRLGTWAFNTGDKKRCTELLQAAAAHLRDAGLLGEAAASLSLLSLNYPKLDESAIARQAAEQALALSRQAGDSRQEAVSLRRLAILLYQEDQYDEAWRYAEAALKLHREVGDRAQEVHGLNVISHIQGLQGKYQEAAKTLEQGLTLAESIDFRHAITMLAYNLMTVAYRCMGDYERPVILFSQMAEKARQAADLHSLEDFLPGLQESYSVLGQFKRSVDVLNELGELVERRGDKQLWASVQAQLGREYAQLGDFGRAHQLLESGWAILKDSDAERLKRSVRFQKSFVAWLGQDIDHQRQAVDDLSPVLQYRQAKREDYGLAYILDLLARLYLALGEPIRALEFSSQIWSLRRMEIDNSLEQFSYTQSRVLRALGRNSEADEFLNRAYARLTQAAFRLQNPEYRQSFLYDVRYNRELLAEARQSGISI